jgi:hypothetical protein
VPVGDWCIKTLSEELCITCTEPTEHPCSNIIFYSTTTLCPKSILEAQKEWSLLVPCLDCMLNAATLLYILLISLPGHPDCEGYHSVMMDDDTKVRNSWFLSLSSFSQSVQCIAITSSTDSPISREKVHQQYVTGIPNTKGYIFTSLIDLYPSLIQECISTSGCLCLWCDTILHKVWLPVKIHSSNTPLVGSNTIKCCYRSVYPHMEDGNCKQFWTAVKSYVLSFADSTISEENLPDKINISINNVVNHFF